MSRAPAIRVGLLGCGRIARLFHLEILAQAPGLELVAVADPDEAALRVVGERVATTRLVEDFRDVVRDPGIDAVVICLPPDLHAEAATAAFGAGKHAFVEKPLATTLDDGFRVRDAWRASGRVGMTGFNQRFTPAVERLKRILRAGRIGEVVAARAVMGSEARDLPEWKRTRASGGGVLLDLASHLVDLTRFVLEREVRSVSAVVTSIRTEEDSAAMAMHLDDGRMALSHVTLAGVQEARYEVVGEDGRAIMDHYADSLRLEPLRPPYGRLEHLQRGLDDLREVPRAVHRVLVPPDPQRTYRRALGTFVRAIVNGSAGTPDIEDGLRSLAVVMAAEESARRGGPVEVEDLG